MKNRGGEGVVLNISLRSKFFSFLKLLVYNVVCHHVMVSIQSESVNISRVDLLKNPQFYFLGQLGPATYIDIQLYSHPMIAPCGRVPVNYITLLCQKLGHLYIFGNDRSLKSGRKNQQQTDCFQFIEMSITSILNWIKLRSFTQ